MVQKEKTNLTEKSFIKFAILIFWTFYWFFNVADKFIGGPIFLWVGQDRFAQFVKFFSSIGLTGSIVPNTALIIGSCLEILAFVLCSGALLFFMIRKEEETNTWYFWGTWVGLFIFLFFSIGDQIFGDRFELFEHTTFWVIILVSWAVFIWVNTESSNLAGISWRKYSKGLKGALLIVIIMGIIAGGVVTNFSLHSFSERTSALYPIKVGEGIYRFDFPFLGGKTVWEKSLNKFLENNPDLNINFVYTAPMELETKKKDNLFIYLFTEER